MLWPAAIYIFYSDYLFLFSGIQTCCHESKVILPPHHCRWNHWCLEIPFTDEHNLWTSTASGTWEAHVGQIIKITKQRGRIHNNKWFFSSLHWWSSLILSHQTASDWSHTSWETKWISPRLHPHKVRCWRNISNLTMELEISFGVHDLCWSLHKRKTFSSCPPFYLEPWRVSLLQVNKTQLFKTTTSVLDISFQLFDALTPVLEF